MSIGFTVPVVMLCGGPLADARSIGMIILCFILTGLFNTLLAYLLAFPLQCLLVRHDTRFWNKTCPDDTEKGGGDHTTKRPIALPATPDSAYSSDYDDHTKRISPARPANNSITPLSTSRVIYTRLTHFARHHPILLASLLLTLTVGLPLRLTLHLDIPMATLLLITTWLATLVLQAAVKSTAFLTPRPRVRTLLTGLTNPVLWTSLFMIAYILIDSTLSNRPIPTLLDTLNTTTPLSTLLARSATSSPAKKHAMTAGSISLTILNAGLVSWGFKLFEHRTRILSRAGLTVCTVSSFLALPNTSCYPLFAAHAMGINPASRAAAFAARSVTIALGTPVMGVLDGDEGLNASMVVASGIVYQMGMGFGVGGWLERRVAGRVAGWFGLRADGGLDLERGGERRGLRGTRVGESRSGDTRPEIRGTRRREPAGGVEHSTESVAATEVGPVMAEERENDPRTVAAGVTVGVNAAAMGAAYLYEAKSEAAPHAALAMIALGIMTVVFGSIPPLATWIVDSLVVAHR
ncbi:hypothetical protein VTJ49DRAFT_1538 [Mycothermus thermophilus]|uniref:LrgB-like protein n=1 Tax=Humicola insolens TaxID=85995 RepID=A0ABR3VCH9_HUMIN